MLPRKSKAHLGPGWVGGVCVGGWEVPGEPTPLRSRGAREAAWSSGPPPAGPPVEFAVSVALEDTGGPQWQGRQEERGPLGV